MISPSNSAIGPPCAGDEEPKKRGDFGSETGHFLTCLREGSASDTWLGEIARG